jgi:SWI/SNF-related matrix-associated actin-dependent regulator 1 of chromatin subfamily A
VLCLIMFIWIFYRLLMFFVIQIVSISPYSYRRGDDKFINIELYNMVTVMISFSFRLVTKGSVDENIYEIARRKLVLDAAILQSGAELEDSTDVPEKTMGEILASLLLV